ncbi:hypothetical protein D1007_55838 [Hordeum vulgare]|nr:hypothetical protein D1007_55838 [Hordeum vulgare]
MNPLLNNALSGGCAFPSVASALRLPAASLRTSAGRSRTRRRRTSLARAASDGSDGAVAGAVTEGDAGVGAGGQRGASAEPAAEKQQPVVDPRIEKELKKAVQKTAATFAPRASTKSKNPAVPGSTLYTIFEVQAYASMLAGGALSFNLVFPSSEPDIWRLMGMWSIWMFTMSFKNHV